MQNMNMLSRTVAKTGYKRKRTKWVLVDMYKNVIYVYSALDGQECLL